MPAAGREPLLHRLRKSPSGQVIAAACGVAALLIAVVGLYQWQSYDATIQRAERDTRNATGMLAEHAARTMDAVEGALEGAARIHADMEARRIPRDRATLHSLLRSIQ